MPGRTDRGLRSPRAVLLTAVLALSGAGATCAADDSSSATAGDTGSDGQAANERTSTSRASSADPADLPDPTGSIEGVLERGAEFVVSRLETIDVASMTMFDYLYRRYSIEQLAPARVIATDRAARHELVDDELLLERLVVPDAPRPAIDAGAERTTGVLAAALHCDREPLTPAELGALEDLVDGGGYDTTHAALAIGWAGELGCETPELTRLRDATVERLCSEFTQRSGVTDLALEQSATLSYLGAGDRLPETWLRDTIAAQREDGGWGERQSNWHMTLLAMWTIATMSSDGSGAPMVSAAS